LEAPDGGAEATQDFECCIERIGNRLVDFHIEQIRTDSQLRAIYALFQPGGKILDRQIGGVRVVVIVSGDTLQQ
jgi:hypothetical protein